ncbi:ABC transporter transmembrane domain-containing protein [Azohydromonas australica]|uniref:ABC transporter transmembrane domain-containing protein n=1 Tax=Azohydromonas australica TaxID=364039 RepID=UPI0004231B3A|nr:ABC transporter transmembrane domain-containing protein [Azohydromonas australica]
MDGASTCARAEARQGRGRRWLAALLPKSGPGSLGAAGKRLGRCMWPYRWALGGGVLSFFGAAALEPLAPALLQRLLDHGFGPQLGFPLWIVPVVVVGLFALRGLLSFCGTYLFAWSTSKGVLDLRRDLVRALVHADARLFASLSPGVAAARVINDPQNATASLSNALTTLLKDGTSFVALLGYLFYLNWRLALVSLVTAPLLGWVVQRVKQRVVMLGARSYESQVRLTGIVDDIARAWRVVRTFDAGDFEEARFAAEAQRFRHATVKSAAAAALMSPLTQLVASLGVALIITLALLDATRGGITVGEFAAFVTALLMTISPLRRLTDVTQPVITGLIVARACFELVDTPAEPDSGEREIDGVRQGIRLQALTVMHPGAEHPALADLDLDVPAGQTLALVGPSGGGKSTLVSTLLRFVTPSAGSVLIDGIDIADIRKASLRRQFAVVSQDIVLFDGTIEDNVAYAQPKDSARVERCLRAAHLWDFVQSLPEGMHTGVGTNGARLSGGQRQRLAIARALYKEAAVWVFDEATSALDSESERIVHRAIEEQRGSRTLILIAHRLSTVRRADRIVVLSEGRMVESGRHEELLAAGGLYAGMVRAQTLD